MDVFKIIGLAITGVVLSVVLKQYRSEYQIVIALLCGVLLFALSLDYIKEIFYELSLLVERSKINGSFFSVMLKSVGVACLCEIGVNLCRDAGESAIGSKLEFAGKLILLFLALPVFLEVLSVLSSFVNG